MTSASARTTTGTMSDPVLRPVVSIIVPTVPGREDHYQRCTSAYVERAARPFEIITEYDHPTVGRAWQAGADKAVGDYIHLTCDDLEPMEGWDTAAIAACDDGCLPAPRVVNATTGAHESRPVWGAEFGDGTDCGISVIPFMSRAQWEKIRPLFLGHYYTDDFISERGRALGWRPLMVNGYSFRHHWAQHRRGAGMTEAQRMTHDHEQFYRAMDMVRNGQWDKPWPA